MNRGTRIKPGDLSITYGGLHRVKINPEMVKVGLILGVGTPMIGQFCGCSQWAVWQYISRRGISSGPHNWHVKKWPKWTPPYLLCWGCLRVKPSTDFSSSPKRTTGVFSRCIECLKKEAHDKYVSHKADYRRRDREWAKSHRQYRRSLDSNRRVRHHSARGSCTLQQWIWRVEAHGWRCFYCGKELDERTLTRDHRIPLSKGGCNWPSNLVPSCKSCNCRKSATHPREIRI